MQAFQASIASKNPYDREVNATAKWMELKILTTVRISQKS
jgi:hypothetical protein